MSHRTLEISWRGRISYRDGLALQREIVAAVQEGRRAETLLFFEVEPVLTLGSGTDRRDILASRETLARLGIETCECDRGGGVTYHGPGQLVGYPIIDLAPDRKDLLRYLRDLESMLIRGLHEYDVAAGRRDGWTGAWVGGEKIAAIGVRVSRWVTSHGFALNVAPQLEHFRTIVPCGIRDRGVTSMAKLGVSAPGLPDVAGTLARHFGEVFGRNIRWIGAARAVGVDS